MRWFFILSISVHLFAGSFDEVVPSSPEEIASLTCDLLIDGFVSAASGQIALSELDLCVKGAQDLLLKRIYIPPQILGRYDDKDDQDKLFLGKALNQLKVKGWVTHPHLLAGYNRHSPYFQITDPSGFTLEFKIQGSQGVFKTSPYGCSNLKGGKPDSSVDIRNITLSVEGNKVIVVWPDGIQRQYVRYGLKVYRLEKEVLSNGKIIQYEYDGDSCTKISSLDPSGKFIYASIVRVGNGHYVGSDGREVDLVYETREIKGRYKKGHYEEKINIPFPVMTRASSPTYVNMVGYNERTLLTSYEAKSYPISCSYFQTKNTPSRIQTFSTPSGSTSFSYDAAVAGQKGGSTTVVYSDGAKVVYRFSKNLLLEAIENWYCETEKNEEELISKKTFDYDHKQHIKNIETWDGKGKLLIAKRFECDDAGNPLLETTEGDFGSFSIRRRFDKNRLVFESRDDDLQYEFTYLGNTHLVTSKTIFEGNKKLRKTVNKYDDSNNLILVEEEGKTKTIYTLYQTIPHLHRVEWEEQTDWENQLIYKIRYAYDQWGNIQEEQHFNSHGKIAYIIQRTYNEKGELLDETNPLGHRATYQYDARGRCVYEEPFSNGLVLKRRFDAKGRLAALVENTQNTTFEYNSSDELTKKTDYLGHTTIYKYDPVHGKPNWIEEPLSITKIIYDAFGREEERIDPYEAKTVKSFNSYGDIVKITYPNGGKEVFDYFPNGLLKRHIDPDGLITTYTYDALGRVKEQKIGDHTTVFHYDGYNLYKTIDPAGFITEYKYDFLGRKIEEKRENRVTYYGYDTLGFLAWEKRGKRQIHYTHDCVGRLRKKSIDHVLDTLWTYDAGGNIASIEQGEGITTFKYDAHDRLIEKIDPENYKTTIFYEKGSQILLKKITNPIGIETIETYNSKGRLLKKEVAGQVVGEFGYDKLSRLKTQDHFTFGYTLNGKPLWAAQAEKRITHWTYTPGDRIVTKQKPDGTILLHKYDAQQRLKKIGTREFQYDELDRIVGGNGFSRTFDPFGNIQREEWSNGLWIESDYDDWDRPTERRFSDQSRVTYEYEGPFLKKVTRIASDGSEVYSHFYDQYSSQGNPTCAHGFFTTTYDYDKSGRQINQFNPYFHEVVHYDPIGNLIQKGNIIYTYDATSQMTSELDRFSAKYDAHYNLIEFNGESIGIDALNQIEGLSYDLNGNLLKPGFVYDEFDQLIEAEGEAYAYDPLGRKIQKGKTSYLYIGDEEIGAFENGKAKELKINGLHPISVEIEEKPYVSITDVQGTIRLLIDPISAEIARRNDCDAFGGGLTEVIPYAYSGKRHDAKTGLVYFGKRFYDPSLRRWLTPDPIGSIDHSNLYQYVFNNPFFYQDPTGESIGGYLLGLGEIVLGGTIIVGGFALEVVTIGGFTVGLGMTMSTGAALIGIGLATTTYHAQDIQIPNVSWKNTNPFNGPVDGEIYVGDAEGNIIPVPQGHQMGGSKDGKCLEVKDAKNEPTGVRKDGKGHPEGPKHSDSRAWRPHAHRPGITNSDGTPWLSIY